MDKRIWINVGLLAAILLLSAVLYFPDKKTEPELTRLSTIEPASISRIDVIRKGMNNFIFGKQDNIWKMLSPLQFKANEARINAMLHILNVESYGTLNPDEVELERFELADPKVIMKLNDYEFCFGNTDAIDQRRYVLFDNKIHMVNDSLYQQLMTNVAFFADTKLLPDDFDISSIQFPENTIEKVNEQWQLKKLMDINPTELSSIVYSWKNASAISVSIYEAPETESFISITSPDKVMLNFVIVATEPHLILGREDLGIQFHMGSDDAERMLLHENEDKEADETTEVANSPG